METPIVNVALVTERPFPIELPDGSEDYKLPNPYFECEHEDGTRSRVSLDADHTNRHYQEIAEWYSQQTKPPFKYDFGG